MPKTEWKFYLSNGEEVVGTNAPEAVPILRELAGYELCTRTEYVRYMKQQQNSRNRRAGLFKEGHQ